MQNNITFVALCYYEMKVSKCIYLKWHMSRKYY